MWPFAGLLTSRSFELQVPGQDSPATITALNGGAGGSAIAGLRFLTTGLLQRRMNSSFFSYTDMWIDDDAHGLVDASLYECRITSLSGDTGSFLGPTVWTGITGSIDFSVSAAGGQFDFVQNEVSGIIQVREIADVSNIRSGNVTFRATWEGLL